MVARAGPLATICCKPRQAWKGAAVTMALCAEVRLVQAAALTKKLPELSIYPHLKCLWVTSRRSHK